jgi:hypothetical protein
VCLNGWLKLRSNVLVVFSFPVAYLSFISFVLLAAACDDQEWIMGGLEFDIQNRRQLVRLCRTLLLCLSPYARTPPPPLQSHAVNPASTPFDYAAMYSAAGDESNLGATTKISLYFQLGLAKATTLGNRPAPFSGNIYARTCVQDIAPYIRNWNGGAFLRLTELWRCGRSFLFARTSPRNFACCTGAALLNNTFSPRWAGAKPIKIDVFSSTLGLMGFATAVQARSA